MNSSNKNEYISWDITDLYNAWLDGSANHGIALKQIGSEDMDVLFTSENAGSNRPRMVVNYRDMKGIESYWSFSSQSAGMAGVGSVNNATGNLVFQIPTKHLQLQKTISGNALSFIIAFCIFRKA